MKSPTAFLASILGGMLLSGPIFAVYATEQQLPVESFLSQENRRPRSTSPGLLTRQDNIKPDSIINDNRQDSARQSERDAKNLEVELRKILLLCCPR